jgi:hypothetical protein
MVGLSELLEEIEGTHLCFQTLEESEPEEERQLLVVGSPRAFFVVKNFTHILILSC